MLAYSPSPPPLPSTVQAGQPATALNLSGSAGGSAGAGASAAPRLIRGHPPPCPPYPPTLHTRTSCSGRSVASVERPHAAISPYGMPPPQPITGRAGAERVRSFSALTVLQCSPHCWCTCALLLHLLTALLPHVLPPLTCCCHVFVRPSSLHRRLLGEAGPLTVGTLRWATRVGVTRLLISRPRACGGALRTASHVGTRALACALLLAASSPHSDSLLFHAVQASNLDRPGPPAAPGFLALRPRSGCFRLLEACQKGCLEMYC